MLTLKPEKVRNKKCVSEKHPVIYQILSPRAFSGCLHNDGNVICDGKAATLFINGCFLPHLLTNCNILLMDKSSAQVTSDDLLNWQGRSKGPINIIIINIKVLNR